MPAGKVKDTIPLFGPIGQVRVKYKDVFDLKEFYDALHEYLLEHEWQPHDGGREEWETYYGERIGQTGSKEIWIIWKVKKDTPGKKIIYHLDFTWHCIGIQKTEIVKEGRKWSAHKGEAEIIMKAYLQQKYLTELGEHPILKHFKGVVGKRLYHKDLELKKKELYQEVYAMQSWIKQWFKMKRYLPYDEAKSFYPSFAWPSHLKE